MKADFLISTSKLPTSNFDVLFVRWEESYNVTDFKKNITDQLNNKIIIFIIDSRESCLVRYIIPKLENNFKFIFWLNKLDFKGNDIFEISNFFSCFSTKKNCKNRNLRELYNYYSYKIFLHSKYANPIIKSKTHKEFRKIKNINLSDHNFKMINGIRELYKNGVGELNLEKSGYHLKIILQNLFTRFLQKFDLNKTKNINKYLHKSPNKWKKVLITGWYGTETAGDKAILGEIVFQLKKHNPKIKIFLTSIDIRLSWCTRDEMELDIDYIDINDSVNFLKNNNFCSLIFGGGPLMDSSKIKIIHNLFKVSNEKQMTNVIYGCGVGPIKLRKNKKLISSILKLSDIAFFRDNISQKLAIDLGLNKKKSFQACDPALNYVLRYKQKSDDSLKTNFDKIPILIRKTTKEYGNGLEGKSFFNYINKSDKKKYSFLPMHSYWRGNDDRVLFYDLLHKKDFKFSEYPYFYYKNLNEILLEINSSKFTIAMRYHSHIFSLGLKKPFLSIDYTGPNGKVSNFNNQINNQSYFKISKFDEEYYSEKLNHIEKNYENISKKLDYESKKLSNLLNNCYAYFWK